VLLLLVVPPFALIGLAVVALAALAALVALAGAALAAPYLIVRSVRRRFAASVGASQSGTSQRKARFRSLRLSHSELGVRAGQDRQPHHVHALTIASSRGGWSRSVGYIDGTCPTPSMPPSMPRGKRRGRVDARHAGVAQGGLVARRDDAAHRHGHRGARRLELAQHGREAGCATSR
jgi:hypothetical protein